MNIYLLSQTYNTNYDTYDSMVVVAKSPQDAKKLTIDLHGCDHNCGSWVNETILIHHELIGKANKSYKETTLILQSFNAG